MNDNTENFEEYSVKCDYRNPYIAVVNEINQCPICKKIIKPTFVYGRAFRNNNKDEIVVIYYLCNGCHNSFMTQYSDKIETNPGINTFKKLDYVAPNRFKEENFSDCIQENFGDFIKIYNQALEAEHYKLDEISGMGYRKALEFLIKDFLIKENPNEQQKIENLALGLCIEQLVDNEQLKRIASRATWLGNDQVHYKKKYEEHDINDLKVLIKVAVKWIEMIYLTKKYEEEIEKK